MTTNKIKLHVVDDHQIVINGILAVVDNQPDIEFVGQSLSAVEAQRWLSENLADVLLLDIHMPGMDGMALCKILKQDFPRMKII